MTTHTTDRNENTQIETKVYKVGEVTIARVSEKLITDFTCDFLLPDWDAAAAQKYPAWGNATCWDAEHKHAIVSTHTWVVKTPQYTILIDTATGNDKPRPFLASLDHLHEPYLERLAALGVTPESVGFVLLTHLHVDHVGWNTKLVDGRWVPTFPNARYIFPKADSDEFSKPENSEIPSGICYVDSVLPVIEAGLAEMVGEQGGEVLDGISFIPTPGHCVGHMSIRLTSRGEEALFGGDLLHHPIQVYRPDWKSVFCADPERARESREWALNYAADHHAIYFSSHFADTSAGLVTRNAGGFEWQFI